MQVTYLAKSTASLLGRDQKPTKPSLGWQNKQLHRSWDGQAIKHRSTKSIRRSSLVNMGWKEVDIALSFGLAKKSHMELETKAAVPPLEMESQNGFWVNP